MGVSMMSCRYGKGNRRVPLLVSDRIDVFAPFSLPQN
jgi:hypothetical protein